MHVNRRAFLRRSIHAALGGVGLYSALGNMKLVAAAAHQSGTFDDYKALVCVFLHGGNDSFNTLVPIGGAKRADYAAARGALALPAANLHPLTPLAGGAPDDGANYGFHAAMPELAALFNTDRKLAVVANVGTLLHPVTRQQYRDGSVAVPPQLFSHEDQIRYWQTGRPDDEDANGWGGRIADRLHDGNIGQTIPMSISTFGENIFQRADEVNAYSVDAYIAGVSRIGYREQPGDPADTAALNGLLAAQYGNVFERGYASAINRSIGNYTAINTALNGAPPLATPFPASFIGLQLKKVAQLIGIRGALQMQRQVFFVLASGYDTHTAQINDHATNLRELSQALDAFYRATVELGVQDGVTAFTASDFGRTLSGNGNGTDHGWGGHHFVLGGAVDGGRFHGKLPSLRKDDNPDDAYSGQIIPTTAVDQYAASLASWFGVDAAGIGDIFPNLDRFDEGPVPLFL